MNKRIKSIIFLVLFLSCLNTTNPISESSAKWWGVGAGVVGTVVVGGVTYFVLNDGKFVPWNNNKLFIGGAAGAVGGALIGYLVYKGLLSCTPQAMYSRARNIVESIADDSLINGYLETPNDVIKHITFRFGTSWTLVLARTNFEGKRQRLNDAYQLLRQVEDEARNDVQLHWLVKKCKKLKETIKPLIQLTSDRMALVVDSRDYKQQVALYEKYKEAERQRAFKRDEKSKDRWLEGKKHHDKMRRKDKDRRQKQQFLNTQQGQGNVKVNVNL